MDESALEVSRASIERICANFGVRVTEANGPEFDKKVL